MYKAKIKIGEYNIGDEVPAELAEVWATMYKESPVEKIEGKKTTEKSKAVVEKPDNKAGSILDDYLGRNKNVVKKNILEDKLSKKQLEELFEIESSDKNRKVVLASIKFRLKSFN